MPPTARSIAVETACPGQIAQLAAERGYILDFASDEVYENLANEVLINNAPKVIHGYRIAQGDTIELPADFAEKLRAAGASDLELREFAAQVHPNVDAATALRKLDRDIKRSRGLDAPEPTTESKFFDRPY